jgi:hypothetical protein
MRLGGAEVDGAAHLAGALGDGQPSAEEVDPTDAEAGQLPEAQARVGEQPDGVAVLPRCLGEPLDMLPGEEARLGPSHSRQRDADRRVAGDATVADAEGEDACQDPVGLSHGRRREAAGGHLCHPGGDVGMHDVGEPVPAPAREDLRPQQRLIR